MRIILRGFSISGAILAAKQCLGSRSASFGSPPAALGNSFVGRPPHRLHWPSIARRVVATLIFAVVAAASLSLTPQPAAAGEHWYNVWGDCTPGVACAADDWYRRWGSSPTAVLEYCQLDYDSSGRVAGSSCKGNDGGNNRGGDGSLDCTDRWHHSSEGCMNQPPPPHETDCKSTTKNPIDTRSGMTVERREDFTTGGPFPLKLERFYASSTVRLMGLYTPSRLGRGWRSNFDSALYRSPYSWTSIILPSGETFLFDMPNTQFVQAYWDWDWNGILDGNMGRFATLTQDPTSHAYTLTIPEDHTTWVYDQNGRLLTIDYQNGYSQSLTYDANGNNTLVTDSFGRTLQFSYSNQGLLNSVTVPGGQTYQYTYLARWTLTPAPDPTQMPPDFWALEYVIQPDTTQLRYHYENTNFPFALTGITNEAGVRYATWTYGTDGRVASEERAGGVEHYSFAYDDTAMTTTVTNPLSKNTVYHFTLDLRWNNRLTQLEGQASTNCVASNSYIAYDSNGYVTDGTDAEGRVTHYVRDSRGNPTTVTRAYGTASAQTNTYTWDSTRNLPTEAVQPGLTTDNTWNATGQLTQVTQTDTTSQTVPYSSNGQTRTWAFNYTGALLTSIDGPLAGTGDTVYYAYDANGYLSSSTNEVGQVTTVNSVNGRGQPTSVTDPNSVVTNLAYDPLGRLTSMTVDPSGLSAVTTIAYNAVGDVTQITRPNGAYLQYTYDDARRVTKVQDNSGAYTEYDRDNLGNATARRIKDSGGTLQLSQTAVFDELGRLLKFIGASSQTWTHAYDRTDNRVSVTDPRSNVFQWGFDALNRLISTTDEESNAVSLTRNGKDEITNYSDPRSLSTSYVRNGFGEVIQRTSPDTGTTVYTYNTQGKPTQITDGRGVVTNLSYDNAGRLLTKQYPAASSENITYTWDDTTSSNKGIGRVTQIQDASGTVQWIYNILGQVTQETKTTSSVVYTIGYAYDLDGNVTQITYPSGRTVSYSRGSTGLVTGVTTQASSASASVTLASAVAYQPFGPLQTLTYGNGLILWKTFTQDYSPNTLIVEQGSNSVINRSYGYGYGDFNITNLWDTNVAARTENYVYTPSTRLQNTYGSWGELAYYQDGVGNRTFDIFNDNTTTTTKTLLYPYNTNQVGGITQDSTTLRTITHDGAGNIITNVRGSTTYNYRYNNRGRLDQLTIGSTVTANYSYDGLERMSVRTTQNMTPAGTTHYIYDRAGRLLVEASGTGTTQREYVWIDDTPLALFADLDTGSPKQWYVHPDHLDRPTKMTDASQAVVWDAYYWPYGEVRSITGSASNNLRFPGQYFLVESGLHYNWHRHYDPTLGRYIQPDPLGFIDGPSVYTYAKSAPTINVDPTGLAEVPTSVPDSIPGGPWTPAGPGQRPGTFFGPKPPSGPRAICRWVPKYGEGGPPGSKGYFKTQDPGSPGWNRFGPDGKPLTPEEAHPNLSVPPWLKGGWLPPIPLPPICDSIPGACGGNPDQT